MNFKFDVPKGYDPPRDRKGGPKKFYCKASNLIINSEEFRKLKPTSVKLYMYLIQFRNIWGNGFSRTDIQLSQDTGMSSPTIWKARDDLIESGIIFCMLENPRYTTRYYLHNVVKKKDQLPS